MTEKREVAAVAVALSVSLSACGVSQQRISAVPQPIPTAATFEDRGCEQITATLHTCETPEPEPAVADRTHRYETFEPLGHGQVRACGCGNFGIAFCQITEQRHVEALKRISDPELVCEPDVNLFMTAADPSPTTRTRTRP